MKENKTWTLGVATAILLCICMFFFEVGCFSNGSLQKYVGRQRSEVFIDKGQPNVIVDAVGSRSIIIYDSFVALADSNNVIMMMVPINEVPIPSR